MIKGCQKRIIHLKNTGSPYFEEAYFIMKDNTPSLQENDMIKEAMRIAGAASAGTKAPPRIFKNAIPALIGAAIASFLFGIVLLFVAL